jgi:hypothetical protein
MSFFAKSVLLGAYQKLRSLKNLAEFAMTAAEGWNNPHFVILHTLAMARYFARIAQTSCGLRSDRFFWRGERVMSKKIIEIDIDDYIDMLEDRRREIRENHNWAIPDGVWDRLVEDLENGHDFGNNKRPNSVVDNIATNGNFGPVEKYDVFKKMVRTVIEDAAEEGITYTEDCARDHLEDISFDSLREIAESADAEGARFFYEEPDSDYGLGVCYWYLP